MNAFAKTAANMSATASTITISGRILIPWVSSSKKRNKPALAAGIGELFSRFFSLLNFTHFPKFHADRVELAN